jgi:hypothetical protein
MPTGPLFGDLEVLSRTPAALAAYLERLFAKSDPPQEDVLPEGTVQLEAPEQDISPELKEAFLQGTLGGAAAGGAGRGASTMVPYTDAYSAQGGIDVLMGKDPGVNYYSQMPSDAARRSFTDLSYGYGGHVPEIVEAQAEYLRRYDEMFPGATEQYYGSGGGSISPTEDLRWRGILPEQAGFDPRFRESARHMVGDVVEEPDVGGRFGSAGLEEDFDSSRRLRRSLYDQTVGDAERAFALREAERAADRIRSLARKRDLARQMVKSGVKGMVNPVNIAADALIGGTVGATAAGAGHVAGGGDRESAGLFTPPGEGYEGLVRPEDIERVAEQKEVERQTRRDALMREAIERFGLQEVMYSLPQGVTLETARIEDIANILGPLR